MSTAAIVQDDAVDTATGEVMPVRSRNGNRSIAMLRPIASPAEVIETQNETRRFVHEALKEGRDYGVIPGTDRKTMLKPGAERTALAFGCVYGEPILVEQEIDHDRIVKWRKVKNKYEWHGGKKGKKIGEDITDGESVGLYRYVLKVPVIHLETGNVVAVGVGSCSTMENKYIDRPRDMENTVLKMAHKRSLVAACLLAFGLSDEFTQDVEDMPAEHFGGDGDGSRAAPANEPEAKCPECGGKMWDNRVGKKNPKAPDFKCRDRDCDGVYWPGQWPPKEAAKEEAKEGASPARGSDRPLPIPGAEHVGQPLREIPMTDLKNYADQCKIVLAKQRKQKKDTTATEGLLEDIVMELDARSMDMMPKGDTAVIEEPDDELSF